jgi:nucleoside-diphosphate-sugar epimerase
VQRVLVTGAYGLIGNLVYAHLSSQPQNYAVYGLDRNDRPSERIYSETVTYIPKDRFFQVDLADSEGLNRVLRGVDSIIHLAADPGSGNWDSLLQNNLIGVHNIFEACRLNAVKRIVFASTVLVNSGYRYEEPYKSIFEGRFLDAPPGYRFLTVNDPVKPTSSYAATKVWGEALGYSYSIAHDLSVLCVRIGWVIPENRPRPNYGRAVWCSFRDICQLFQRCLEADPAIKFEIFYGFSDNQYRFADIENARVILGYDPLDNAEDYPF